jgi:hypothetical protein
MAVVTVAARVVILVDVLGEILVFYTVESLDALLVVWLEDA